jgi:tetratricopeptide (TPR) repeat protein
VRNITLLLTYILVGAVSATAQSADDEAIKQLLHDETVAFYARNADVLEAKWLHDPNVNAMLVSSGRYRYFKGWEAVAERVAKAIKDNPKPIAVEVTNTNFVIRQEGGLAWVEYDHTVKGADRDAEFDSKSHEYRTLVKSDGVWKIAAQIHVATDTFNRGTEANLNDTGYELLTSGKIKEAIEVLSLNVKLFPDSWNAYDSLGEAYATAGQKDLAIQNYEKSVQLNPKNENGKAALQKLRGK